MNNKVAVYKIQDRNMEDGTVYSKMGVFESHYYFAKANGGKLLFTTESKLFLEPVSYVLLTLPKGEVGFLTKFVEKGTYPALPTDKTYKVPCQWNMINETTEKENAFNWIALDLSLNINN